MSEKHDETELNIEDQASYDGWQCSLIDNE